MKNEKHIGSKNPRKMTLSLLGKCIYHDITTKQSMIMNLIYKTACQGSNSRKVKQMYYAKCIQNQSSLHFQITNFRLNTSIKSNKNAMPWMQLSGYDQECIRILSLGVYLIQCVQNEKIQLLTAIFWNVYENRVHIIKGSRFLIMQKE